MAREKMEKTNAVRILEQKKLPFSLHSYCCGEFTDGTAVADLLGEPREQVFKTLVTVGKSGGYTVFVIPVAEELDRKKAAAAVGEKSLELLPVKELFPLTGYVRGGCTAIGMKKQFPTVLHVSAMEQDTIFVSGGRLGLQIQLKPEAVSYTHLSLLQTLSPEALCAGRWIAARGKPSFYGQRRAC